MRIRSRAAPATGVAGYFAWLQKQRLTNADRERLRAEIAPATGKPLLSLLMAVSSVDEQMLRRTFECLASQIHGSWELLIAVAGPHVESARRCLESVPALAKQARLFGVALPASAALNRLMEESRAEFSALLDPGDELEPDALLELAVAIQRRPDHDCFYSDEDLLHPEAGYCQPHFKPDWSPERFRADGYVGRLAAYRTAAVKLIGGFRAVFDGAHEFDLLLRLTAPADCQVTHLPRVLYHRRGLGVRPWADPDAARRVPAEARSSPTHDEPRVSIVIPTAGRPALIRGKRTTYLGHCVDSIRRRSTYAKHEVIAVDNGDLTPELVGLLESHGVRRVTYAKPFNLAGKMNLGASLATGEYLLFLNDDIEVISPDWIERMLEYARRPGIGAVGAKLFFPDGRLQHVGVHVLEGNPGHPFYGAPAAHEGYFQSTRSPRNYLAVTGACLMTRKDLFESLGGFDERFPLNYNDVDYCLRLHERGQRNVFTPFAELYHFEAVSKEGGASVRPGEIELFHQLWKTRVPRDPYYNDNLSPRGDYCLKD